MLTSATGLDRSVLMAGNFQTDLRNLVQARGIRVWTNSDVQGSARWGMTLITLLPGALRRDLGSRCVLWRDFRSRCFLGSNLRDRTRRLFRGNLRLDFGSNFGPIWRAPF